MQHFAIKLYSSECILRHPCNNLHTTDVHIFLIKPVLKAGAGCILVKFPYKTFVCPYKL